MSIFRILLICGATVVLSQNAVLANEDWEDQQPNEDLLNKVEKALGEADVAELNTYISRAVKTHCDQDYACLYTNYNAIIDLLRRENIHWVAIPQARELVTLTEQEQDRNRQADALHQLYRLNNFIGNDEACAAIDQERVKLFELMGDQEKLIQQQFHIAEGKVWSLNEPGLALPEMLSLLARAEQLGYTRLTDNFHIRLKYVYEEFGYDQERREIVEQLEKIAPRHKDDPGMNEYAFHAAAGRGDLYLSNKQFDKAEQHYLRAVELISHEDVVNDVWYQVYMLLRLARLERERSNLIRAKAYLEESFTLAKEFRMLDHLEVNLKRRIEIAEAEEAYKDALQYTRELHKVYFTQDSISNSFDSKKHYLDLATNKLHAERQKHDFNLRLKNIQLLGLVAGILLAVAVMLLLYVSLRKQQKAKKALSRKNLLIQQQADELQQLDRLKSNFFTNISHELRTPLTLILGPAEAALKSGTLDNRNFTRLKQVQQNSLSLKKMVTAILDLSKMEAHKMEADWQATPLLPFLRKISSAFESQANIHGLQYTFIYDAPEDLTIELDQEKMATIVNNLLSNAIKFTPEGGSIQFETKDLGGRLQFRVKDTGRGVHENDFPYIFDRFYQSKQQNRLEGGTGIGLALSKAYTELMGGELQVESAMGQGSTFTLSLIKREVLGLKRSLQQEPIKEPAQPPNPEPGSVQQESGATAAHIPILIVEDNASLRDYLYDLLSPYYQVAMANNGRKALEYLHQANTLPRLILSDIMMPEMDGYELLEQLKARDQFRGIPVIMLTARAVLQDKLRALRIGVDDYLLKPFAEEELMARIENLLRNYASRSELLSNEPIQKEASQPSPLPVSAEDQAWLEQVEHLSRKHIAQSDYSIVQMSNDIALSERQLRRRLKRLVGLSPSQYLKTIRLQEARALIENHQYSTISQVAYAVGFKDAGAFSKAFKAEFGKTPTEYTAV